VSVFYLVVSLTAILARANNLKTTSLHGPMVQEPLDWEEFEEQVDKWDRGRKLRILGGVLVYMFVAVLFGLLASNPSTGGNSERGFWTFVISVGIIGSFLVASRFANGEWLTFRS